MKRLLILMALFIPGIGLADTLTPTATNSPTITPTKTPIFTRTNTFTPTKTPTITPTKTPTNSPTPTPTKTGIPTGTNSPTPTPTKTPSNTPTASPTTTPLPYVPGVSSAKLQQDQLTPLWAIAGSQPKTSTPTFTNTITATPNLTSTLTFTPTATATPTNTPLGVEPIPQITVVGLGRFSVNPATSATPAIIATAIPSATPYYHKVVASFNNSGTAGGGFGIWAPTLLNSVDVIAPAGGLGSGSTALVVLYGPGQPLSISGPNCANGASAGATITGYLWDYLSLRPFSDMQR